MANVAIHTISIDGDNRLRLFVHGSGFPDYAHIYRDASGVEWDGDVNCLCSEVARKLTHSEWYQIISKAVSREYGETLVLSEQVKWENVPTETRDAISAIG